MEKNNNIGNECLQPIIRYLLVGGLIGIFKFHNITGYDVNDLNLENGIYGINKDGNITLNYPKGIEYGTLIHFVGIGISPKLATNNGIQIAISTTKKIAFRLLWDSWGEWIYIN